MMMMQRGILCNKLGLTNLYCCAFFTIFGFGRVNTTFRKMTKQFCLICSKKFFMKKQQRDIIVDEMKRDEVYDKYKNFKAHVQNKILPRHNEWPMKDRYEKQLPTHNSNYVEYSFRMTKDIQFNRLKAYNLTDLVYICMYDSKL
jgi:hypothetical protein